MQECMNFVLKVIEPRVVNSVGLTYFEPKL